MRTKKTMELKTRGGDSQDKQTPQTTISREEILKIDSEVLDGMGSLNRGRLTKASPESLTLRQMQGAGSAWLASFVGHPDFRKRAIEAGMQDPIAFLKIASSERPKEVHLEAEVNHSVVVVPAQQTPEEWEKQVKTIESDFIEGEKAW